MAAFAQHVQLSSALGAGYAVALWYSGAEPTRVLLAGALCGVAGMLPDLDSDSGKPRRELFGVMAALLSFVLLHRLHRAGVSGEGSILLAGAIYLGARWGAAWLFHHLSVHRGMFHSLPAAVVAAEIMFLAHDAPERSGRLMLAGGVFVGYVSHLVLDELYSVNAEGQHLRFNKAAGSALKVASRSVAATLVAWSLVGVLAYLVGSSQGYFPPPRVALEWATAAKAHRH
jgi:membrane-bound metal-dependent hydrolase YbcI (DUF457 family)